MGVLYLTCMLSLVIALISIIGMIVCACFFPKIKIKNFSIDTFFIAPLIGAIIILISKQLPFSNFKDGLFAKSSINPIEILILFLSMSFISIILDESGFFSLMANVAIKKSKGNQFKLFLMLYLIISLLTIFTSNDIIILTFTPFILLYTKHTNINPIPYLISEFIAANTWSMMFLIGNPTNIYITSYLNIEFFPYFIKMIFPTIGAGLVSFILMYLIFRKSLKEEMNLSIDENKINIPSKPLLISSLIILIITIILMAISNYINISMWIISLTGAVMSIFFAMIFAIKNHGLFKNICNTFKRLPYSVIPFVLSMFTLVLAISYLGYTSDIGQYLDKFEPTYTYGISSFISSNLINNIPMSVLFSDIIKNSGEIEIVRAAYSSVIGSNLGAFLTPLGALAGIMWINTMHEKGVKFGYKEFIKYGIIISVPTILISVSILYFTVNL